MYVLVVRLECYMPAVRNLKAKRAMKNRLVQGLRNGFSVAVSEVDKADVHQTLAMGITTVSGDFKYLKNLPVAIREYVEKRLDGEVTTFEWECFRWE